VEVVTYRKVRIVRKLSFQNVLLNVKKDNTLDVQTEIKFPTPMQKVSFLTVYRKFDKVLIRQTKVGELRSSGELCAKLVFNELTVERRKNATIKLSTICDVL
jgi:hypothetical protein